MEEILTKCRTHQRPLTHYCEVCKKAICSTCDKTTHLCHSPITMEIYAKRILNLIKMESKDLNKVLEQDAEKLFRVKKEFADTMREISNSYANAKILAMEKIQEYMLRWEKTYNDEAMFVQEQYDKFISTHEVKLERIFKEKNLQEKTKRILKESLKKDSYDEYLEFAKKAKLSAIEYLAPLANEKHYEIPKAFFRNESASTLKIMETFPAGLDLLLAKQSLINLTRKKESMEGQARELYEENLLLQKELEKLIDAQREKAAEIDQRRNMLDKDIEMSNDIEKLIRSEKFKDFDKGRMFLELSLQWKETADSIRTIFAKKKLKATVSPALKIYKILSERQIDANVPKLNKAAFISQKKGSTAKQFYFSKSRPAREEHVTIELLEPYPIIDEIRIWIDTDSSNEYNIFAINDGEEKEQIRVIRHEGGWQSYEIKARGTYKYWSIVPSKYGPESTCWHKIELFQRIEFAIEWK